MKRARPKLRGRRDGESRHAAPRGPDTTEGALVFCGPREGVPFSGKRRGILAVQVKHAGFVAAQAEARLGNASCRPAGAGEAVPGARQRASEDGSSSVKAPPAVLRRNSAFAARGVKSPEQTSYARVATRPPRAHAERERHGKSDRRTQRCVTGGTRRDGIGRSWRERTAAPPLHGSASANCVGPRRVPAPHEGAWPHVANARS